MAGYGFRRDVANSRLKIEVAGTEAARLTAASGVTLYGGTLTVTSGGFTVSAGTVTLPASTIAAAAIKNVNGSHMATKADANVIGGGALLFRIKTAGTAAGETINVTLAEKVRVVDAWIVPQAAGGAGDTITVQNAGNAISDAMTAGADATTVRATTLNDANWEIAASGTLRIVEANGANNPVIDVYVLAMRVA